jgi:ATP-dependent DNA helicase RecQ
MDRIRQTLKQIWGYDDFRSPQAEIVRCLLDNRDALIVMPTGGGKSLCFQLPALLSEGVTLVISPLVALMENQVRELTEKKLPAGLLHSELPATQRKQTLQKLANGELRLLYLSPETLLTQPVWEGLCAPELKIDRLILDEAHCLVQWGETFRPTYRRLGAIRAAISRSKSIPTKISIAAFTATADPVTQQTIERVLQLEHPAKFILDPHRANLHLSVTSVWTPRGRHQTLTNFIQQHQQRSGLVYVRTRQASEELATGLRATGDRTAAYHAGLSPQVRWVVHFQPPVLLAEYIQEIGRAGRDGKPAAALLITCEPTGLLYPEDRQRHKFFTESIDRYYALATTLAKQIPPSGNITEIDRQFPQAAIALSLLHSIGELTWETPFDYHRKITDRVPNWQAVRSQQQLLDRQVATYITHRACRWAYLLTAFGCPPPANWRCGNCDRC